MLQLKISPQKLNQLLRKESQIGQIFKHVLPNILVSFMTSYAYVMQFVAQATIQGADALKYHIVGFSLEMVLQLAPALSFSSVSTFLLQQLAAQESTKDNFGVFVVYFRLISLLVTGTLLLLSIAIATADYYALDRQYFYFAIIKCIYNAVLTYVLSECAVLSVQRRLMARFGRAIFEAIIWLFFDEYVLIFSKTLHVAYVKFILCTGLNLLWKHYIEHSVPFLGVVYKYADVKTPKVKDVFVKRSFGAFSQLLLVYQVPTLVQYASNALQVFVYGFAFRKFEHACVASLTLLVYFVQGMHQRTLLYSTARLAGEQFITDVCAMRFKEAVTGVLKHLFVSSCVLVVHGIGLIFYKNSVLLFAGSMPEREYRMAVMHSTFAALADQIGLFATPMCIAIKQPLFIWISACCRLFFLLGVTLTSQLHVGARADFLVNTVAVSTYALVPDAFIFLTVCVVLMKLKAKHGMESSVDSMLTKSVKSLK